MQTVTGACECMEAGFPQALEQYQASISWQMIEMAFKMDSPRDESLSNVEELVFLPRNGRFFAAG